MITSLIIVAGTSLGVVGAHSIVVVATFNCIQTPHSQNHIFIQQIYTIGKLQSVASTRFAYHWFNTNILAGIGRSES